MIAIIKYNAGNITSLKNIVEKLGYECIVTDDKKEICKAEKIIFPGQGEAGTAMQYLKERELDKVLIALTQPVLGICLGLQLMCQFSEEKNTPCLGIFDSVVKKFPPYDIVPHMGWNNMNTLKSPIFQSITPTDNVYFVHSYYADICKDTTAICDYILPFSAAMQKDNFFATQFHPEKSALVGGKILKNFLSI